MKQKSITGQHSAIYKEGFTLIELLIVISIIGLLASIIVVSLNGARAKARDAFRKASLKQVQTALELYYNDNGSYPLSSGTWHGEPGSAWGNYCYADGCGGSGPYIPGLAPAYITRLPSEPRLNQLGPTGCAAASYTSFIYYSNGTDYKFLDHCGPENVPLSSTDPFYDPPRGTYAWSVYSPGGSGF